MKKNYRLILFALLIPMFCTAQERTPNGEVITNIQANLFDFKNVVDTNYFYNAGITRSGIDTVSVDLLISYRGLAIVIDGYIIRERLIDYFAGGLIYYNELGYLNEDKKPFDKDIQIWQHKYK